MRPLSIILLPAWLLSVWGCAGAAAAPDGTAEPTTKVVTIDDAGTPTGDVATASPETPIADAASADVPAATPKGCTPTDPRATAVEVSVLPEAGEAPFVDALASAKSSIRVFGYLMGYGGILDTLTAKAKAGVDVRVILDGVAQRDVNDKYRIALEAAGAKVMWSDPKFAHMHAKVIVVDAHDALITTGNYSKSFMLKERNYVARITDEDDLADLVALFDADWSKTSPDLTCTRLLVAPVNAKERLLALIEGAKISIEVESMQLSETGVQDALFARKAAGVDVRVILANPTWIDANAAVARELTKHGIPSRWLAAPSVHVKALVVDGARAYLGSENFSWTSLAKNREVGVIVSDAKALDTMHTTFESDWSKATAF